MRNEKDAGLPIVKRTACRVGAHVFTYTGYQWLPEPADTLVCDCGLVTYGDTAITAGEVEDGIRFNAFDNLWEARRTTLAKFNTREAAEEFMRGERDAG